jgi:hypothetical protein
MSERKKISLILILFGEALLIYCFLSFGKNLQQDILLLNIIVSSLVYFTWAIDFITPLVKFSDKTQKQIGSIGIRWFVTFFYSVVAIVLMIFLNTPKPFIFIHQVLIHGILFFTFLVGLLQASIASDKVKEVSHTEEDNRNRIEQIKNATKDLQIKIESLNNIPIEITNKINALQENLRYLSPSNTRESNILEIKFLEGIKILNNDLSVSPINIENLIANIKNVEGIYKLRKETSSN